MIPGLWVRNVRSQVAPQRKGCLSPLASMLMGMNSFLRWNPGFPTFPTSVSGRYPPSPNVCSAHGMHNQLSFTFFPPGEYPLFPHLLENSRQPLTSLIHEAKAPPPMGIIFMLCPRCWLLLAIPSWHLLYSVWFYTSGLAVTIPNKM